MKSFRSERGFDPKAVRPANGFIVDAIKERNGVDPTAATPPIRDVAATLDDHQPKTGFKIIMDYNKTSILVSGKDGYIYLVEAGENYDTSAPWGSIDLNSPGVDVDVFGRVMSYVDAGDARFAVKQRVWDPKALPNTERAR